MRHRRKVVLAVIIAIIIATVAMVALRKNASSVSVPPAPAMPKLDLSTPRFSE